ncbi:MAG TPA: hypothetical protein VGM47_09315 [Gammaproteobacteria bacterium]
MTSTSRIFGLALLFAPTLAAAAAPAPSTDMGPVHVDYQATGLTVTESQVLHWIDTARRAVTGYYGRYPVLAVKIRVESRPGSRGPSGTTYGDEDGSLIKLGIGRDMDDDDLQSSWVMTHEMVHLAFPRAPDNQHWAEEGQATYIEPIARAQIGDLSVDYLWQETIEGMPKGLPDDGDQGLDHTDTWGRTYWGGALFYLMADVEIRERTHNKHGLQDALRAVVAAGGNVETASPLEKSFALGDKAVGVPVLEELYAQWKDKPVKVDLDALWRKLGVSLKGDKVVYDDEAPDAAIRRAITTPEP